MIEVQLPYPPSANHVWRSYSGRVVLSAEAKRFRENVYWLLRAAHARPIAEQCACRLNVHPPDRRERDIDNLQKPTLDALQHGGVFLRSDGQVDVLITQRLEPTPGGLVIAKIIPLPLVSCPLCGRAYG